MDINLDNMKPENLIDHIKGTQRGIENIQKEMDRIKVPNEYLQSQMIKYQTRLANAIQRVKDLGLDKKYF